MFSGSAAQERIRTLANNPKPDSFTPLSDHEASTPSSFFGGRPVLHAERHGCHVLVARDVLDKDQFSALGSDESRVAHADSMGPGMKRLKDVSVWITSESVLVKAAQETLEIPYPAISLHATQRLLRAGDARDADVGYFPFATHSTEGKEEISAVYLQVDPLFANREHMPPDGDGDDEDVETIELYVVPQPVDSVEQTDPEGNSGAGTRNADDVKLMFDALSHCADLHPDEAVAGDDEGEAAVAALQGMPGDGGWITAENMHEFEAEYVDAEEVEPVNGDEDLGPGAGSRRARAEEEEGDGVNGDGAEDDTKWQRTG